ncbi:hypothetical protein NDU88_000323 [Pleurodeles waltl]|uniref:Uncharacterized protein n=1 Tax=Pleurodeles waltl TaxID=8319 RepID=A0AAV7Q3T5_PLEWA|nr:hypothetical protein NDU88_000323 [Pleurodeles waltl]
MEPRYRRGSGGVGGRGSLRSPSVGLQSSLPLLFSVAPPPPQLHEFLTSAGGFSLPPSVRKRPPRLVPTEVGNKLIKTFQKREARAVMPSAPSSGGPGVSKKAFPCSGSSLKGRDVRPGAGQHWSSHWYLMTWCPLVTAWHLMAWCPLVTAWNLMTWCSLVFTGDSVTSHEPVITGTCMVPHDLVSTGDSVASHGLVSTGDCVASHDLVSTGTSMLQRDIS